MQRRPRRDAPWSRRLAACPRVALGALPIEFSVVEPDGDRRLCPQPQDDANGTQGRELPVGWRGAQTAQRPEATHGGPEL